MDGQVIGGESLLVRHLNLVKFPHTLFALPFALLGVVAASKQVRVEWRVVVLAVIAFVAARWAALAFNMLMDHRFDALNPRNRQRELARGALTRAHAWAAVGIASVVFLAAAALINPLTRMLSPLALAWVLSYSLSKRFTYWPHLWLGLSLAIAPVGAYLAVVGSWSQPWWALVAITMAVTSWSAGFDIFHALPDKEFDEGLGLLSAVVRLGRPGALRLARGLHLTTIPMLILFGVGIGFGAWYFIGVGIAAVMLAYEHQLVRVDDMSRLSAAFFQWNAILSATVFACALLDRVLASG